MKRRRFVASLVATTLLFFIVTGLALAQTGGKSTPPAPVGTLDRHATRGIGHPPLPPGPIGLPTPSILKIVGTPKPPLPPHPPGPGDDFGTQAYHSDPGVVPPNGDGTDWIFDIVTHVRDLTPIEPPAPPTDPPSIFGIGLARTFGLRPGDLEPPQGDEGETRITYLQVHPETAEEIELTIDISGRLTYRHTLNDIGIGPTLNWNVEVVRNVDSTAVALAFGCFAAAGFSDFPDEFPPGGSHKMGFDTWMTVEATHDAKTVFASADAFVSEEFETLRSVLDAVNYDTENYTVFEFDAWDDATGAYKGGISVQADGDATIRAPSHQGGLRTQTRHRSLKEDRMASLRYFLETASFFTLPACGGTGSGQGGFYSCCYFRMTYSANGFDHTIRFDSESEAAGALNTLVDWLLTVVE